MEDALTLAACLHEEDSVPAALAAYEEERKAVVLSTQRAAQASLAWFENLAQYVDQDPIQFGFNIMTRSRRVGARDPASGVAATGRLARGSWTVNVDPLPSSVASMIRPPCSLTMPWLIDRPSPVPSPSALVVKNGSKT
jgi:hypothetical protein